MVLDKLIKGQKGQMLPAMPFLVLIMIGAIFLSLNVGIMCNEYIKMQTAADIAARDGALVQAEALMLIAPINDVILVTYGQMIEGFELMEDPFTFFEGLAMVIKAYKRIKRLQKAADAIKNAAPALVVAAVLEGAKENGAFVAAPYESVDLDIEWAWIAGKFGKWFAKITKFIGLKGFLLRKNSEVGEKVQVAAEWKSPGRGPRGLGVPFIGTNLFFPNIKTFSRGKPYFIGYYTSRDPRDDSMNWFEQETSMMMPGCSWEAKIAHFNLV